MAYPLPDRPQNSDHPELPPLFVPPKPMPPEWQLWIENIDKDGKPAGHSDTPTIVEIEI
jgi:hypothetical protein